jgi:hypothetical protein
MRLNGPIRTALIVWFLRVLALVPVVLVSFSAPAGAQSVLPSQLPNFLCQNYRALRDLAPFVALIVVAAALVHGLVIRRTALAVDLAVAVIIALIIMNLSAILGTFGLTVSCF